MVAIGRVGSVDAADVADQDFAWDRQAGRMTTLDANGRTFGVIGQTMTMANRDAGGPRPVPTCVRLSFKIP